MSIEFGVDAFLMALYKRNSIKRFPMLTEYYNSNYINGVLQTINFLFFFQNSQTVADLQQLMSILLATYQQHQLPVLQH